MHMVLSKFKKVVPGYQLLGLNRTVHNTAACCVVVCVKKSHHQDHLLRDSANAAVSIIISQTELLKWLNLETSDPPLDSDI